MRARQELKENQRPDLTSRSSFPMALMACPPPSVLHKQGVLYRLDLGGNNGAYLIKDIMQNNQKSISLLSGVQVMRSFGSMNGLLRSVENDQREIYKAKMNQAQVGSLLIDLADLQTSVQAMQTSSKCLAAESVSLRSELCVLSDNIMRQNAKLLEDNMPLLKQFYQIIKENGVQQREQYHRMTRELNAVQKIGVELLKGVFGYETKIVALETTIGGEQGQQ